jgi:hypothetical protein
MINDPVVPQPPKRKCGSTINYHRMLELDSDFRQSQVDLELFTARVRLLGGARRVGAGPTRVQVVVHVVFNTPAENISDNQIHSQLTVLNQDYQAKNSDLPGVPSVWAGLVGNPNIEFGLATVDPEGNPTNGVTRTQTARTSFGVDDKVKATASGGVDPWPTDRYINIWVCNLGGGILGYAQFPGGSPDTDGVVILHSAFGTEGTAAAPFDLGRTAVHEIGHFFNLIHIWGDTNDCSGSDHVADTPQAQLPNYNKPTFPHVSCNNAPNGDMFMNYMDYVDDDSMFMFTLGQVDRIAATLVGPRASLVL